MNYCAGLVRAATIIVLAAALVTTASISAVAFGAVAVGEPKSIAKQGVALGYSYNYENEASAEAFALKKCLGFEGAPAATRALCKVVKTFTNQCFAVAIDPKAGTPGFGWAVTSIQAEAIDSALDQCRRTAGKNRSAFCRVTQNACDKT